MTNPGNLIIISGPSGSGKSTVVQRLMAESELPLALSVSATTRPPRPGEEDGRDYIFSERRGISGQASERASFWSAKRFLAEDIGTEPFETWFRLA